MAPFPFSSDVATKPSASMPFGVPGRAFVAFEKPEGSCSLGKFSSTPRFYVKEVDPSTCNADEDGYEDEYQLEDSEVIAADYILKAGVSNFRNARVSFLLDEHDACVMFHFQDGGCF